MRQFVPLITTIAVTVGCVLMRNHMNILLQEYRNTFPFIVVGIYAGIPCIWLYNLGKIKYPLKLLPASKNQRYFYLIFPIIAVFMKLTLNEVGYFILAIIEEFIGRYIIINLFSYYSNYTIMNVFLS